MIAPRVNAAGRMDDARKACRCSLQNDDEKAYDVCRNAACDNTDRKEADKILPKKRWHLIEGDEANATENHRRFSTALA